MRTNWSAAVLTHGEARSGFVKRLIGEWLVASNAARLEETSVHVVDAAGAGSLVQVIDVLCAEVEAVAEFFFETGESEVRCVWLDCKGVAATHGVEAPDELRVGLPCFGCSNLFDAMAVPQASRAAKGGEAAFGGDACSG
jgi:hypothetical protein